MRIHGPEYHSLDRRGTPHPLDVPTLIERADKWADSMEAEASCAGDTLVADADFVRSLARALEYYAYHK